MRNSPLINHVEQRKSWEQMNVFTLNIKNTEGEGYETKEFPNFGYNLFHKKYLSKKVYRAETRKVFSKIQIPIFPQSIA